MSQNRNRGPLHGGRLLGHRTRGRQPAEGDRRQCPHAIHARATKGQRAEAGGTGLFGVLRGHAAERKRQMDACQTV